MIVPYPGYRVVEEVYMKYEWGETPFCVFSDVKMRAGLIRTIVVKIHHFTIKL
jgi:hypothetical protein